ncbi:MAG: hypothetical protein R3F35_19630 [Myxococcota bacterium]
MREVFVTLAVTLCVGLVWAAYAASVSATPQAAGGPGAIAETRYAGGPSRTS